MTPLPYFVVAVPMAFTLSFPPRQLLPPQPYLPRLVAQMHTLVQLGVALHPG